ncbi:MAG: formylglycine-generating enzyme family protein [Rubripirellula sp.]|nr:formylglycine-generating enzyme family protein [Rubripirellula sp.]
MALIKSTVLCAAVIAMCGGEISAETPPTAFSADIVKLPESTNSIGMKFKRLPPGTFTMGEGDDAHKVTLTKPINMGVYEVTQAQYELVMSSKRSFEKGADIPVDRVSWEDAVEFCRKLSELPAEKSAGNVYHLPTEAEWEFACRAGTTTRFSFGDDESEFGDYAWSLENSGDKTHAVGCKKPNAWGLHDMHGNVWEWCRDWYDDFSKGGLTDPAGPTAGAGRVIRGGGSSLAAAHCRSASRIWSVPTDRFSTFGFRVVQLTSAVKAEP